MAWIFIAVLIIIPLFEIVAFIEIGSHVGVLPTLGLTMLTAVFGVLLVRRQGLSVLARARKSIVCDELPLDSVIHGALILLAGVLLLIPGFVTDTIGLLLLVPALRAVLSGLIWRQFRSRMEIRFAGPNNETGSPRQAVVIDGTAVEIGAGKPVPQRSGAPLRPGQSTRQPGSPEPTR